MAHRERIVKHRGRSNVNQRTWDMIEAAEHLAGFRFVITQGSYNKGGVSASAGTHDGGGVIDLRARDLSARERGIVVLSMRKVGFAAWLRVPSQSPKKPWPYHIHGVAIGDKDLARAARQQVGQYRNRQNGLKGGRRDDGPPNFYDMTWDRFQLGKRAKTQARLINPNDTRPRNSFGQLCLSYKAIQYAGKHPAMSHTWGAYRNSAHRSIKAIFPVLRNQPDTRFAASWRYMETKIRRHPPNELVDPYSWYWFVGKVGFAPPDVNDWPPRPRRR